MWVFVVCPHRKGGGGGQALKKRGKTHVKKTHRGGKIHPSGSNKKSSKEVTGGLPRQ